jgi:hypothetical protein
MDGERAIENRAPTADDSPRAKVSAKSAADSPSPLFLDPPSYFLNSSPLVMDRKSTADDPETFAMNSHSFSFDSK